MKAVVAASREPEDPRDKEVSELYVAYRKGVRAYLINSVGCPEHEADDVLQDTILIVRDRWDQIRTLEKPAAYWYKIAGRRARRLQGQRAKRGCGLDLSVAETAMILDLRPGTVKSQLNAAKKRLKELHRTNSGRWEAEFQ